MTMTHIDVTAIRRRWTPFLSRSKAIEMLQEEFGLGKSILEYWIEQYGENPVGRDMPPLRKRFTLATHKYSRDALIYLAVR